MLRRFFSRRRSQVERLEALALTTQSGGEFRSEGCETGSLEECEMVFRLGFGPNFSYRKILSVLGRNFPREETLIVGDVGGSKGRDAKQLGEMGVNERQGVAAFVIDPVPFITPEILPDNRYIACAVQDRRIPRRSFHFLHSFDSIKSDYTEALWGMHRLLKRGGVALIEIEHWLDDDVLAQLRGLPIKKAVSVFSGGNPKPQLLPEFLAMVDDCRSVLGENADGKLESLFPAFWIDKMH